jgi:hypothetical protein
MRAKWRMITALVMAVSLAGLGMTSSASANASANATTTVTLTFVGQSCEGCVVTPQAFVPGKKGSYAAKSRAVKDGRVTFEVPTNRTRGMSFTINTPRPAAIDALPIIVMQYQGADPGTRVTRAQVLRATSASPCWAGTDQAEVELQVRVTTVVRKADLFGRTRVPIAWVVPTQEAFGGFGSLVKGVLAEQDTWPCGPRAKN